MNKHWIALGLLGTAAMGANAQSSVTLYGSLDAGVAYFNNVMGGSAWVQDSGAISNTFFGFKGTEDLGGGLSAVFKLENGFMLNNGQVGSLLSGESGMFNREAYVGLSSKTAGTVTLGRQYDSTNDYLSPLSLTGTAHGVTLAAHPYDNDNLGGSFSTKNAIKYESADYAGFHFGGMYGFSNAAGQFANGRAWSLGAGYENGPFSLAAAYMQTNNDTNSINGTTPFNANGAASADPNTSALHRVFGVGARYAFGAGTVGVVWTQSQLDNRASSPFDVNGIANGSFGQVTGGRTRYDNIELNGTYSVTPALALIGEYTYTWGKMTSANSNSTSPKWHSVVAAADYSLSKRTDTYVAAAYQHASGTVYDNGSGFVADNVTSIGGVIPPSSTASQIGVAVGIRHRF